MAASTAQDVSALFETVKERVNSYNQERSQLAESLRQIIASAQELLGQLGETAALRARRGRPARGSRGPGRPPGTETAAPRKRGRKRRKMSAEARERIRQAQLKRWAKVKGSASKK